MSDMTSAWQAAYGQVDDDEIQEVEVEQSAGESRAEDHLRALTYHRQRLDEIQEHAQAEIEKITRWEEQETARVLRRCTWHESSLGAWIKAIGAKTVNLINGKVKVVKGRRKVEIVDEALVPAEYLREQVTRTPDKKAILAALEKNGEIVDGTEVITGDDSVAITTPVEK